MVVGKLPRPSPSSTLTVPKLIEKEGEVATARSGTEAVRVPAIELRGRVFAAPAQAAQQGAVGQAVSVRAGGGAVPGLLDHRMVSQGRGERAAGIRHEGRYSTLGYFCH